MNNGFPWFPNNAKWISSILSSFFEESDVLTAGETMTLVDLPWCRAGELDARECGPGRVGGFPAENYQRPPPKKKNKTKKGSSSDSKG